MNNTLTATENYLISSYIQNFEEERKKQLMVTEKVTNKNVLDYGYRYSIVLKRAEIAKELRSCFKFENTIEELDFLSLNIDILQLLPNISLYIKNNFDFDAILSLELMAEDKDWQTLFINIKTNKDWQEADKFINTFLDNLYDTYPQIADKLNVNIMPNEF